MPRVIDLNKITKEYKVGTQIVRALQGIELTVEKGEYVAIMGPSGSGKSTLMNIIGGLDTPSNGSYILNNQDVSDIDDERMAEIRNREIGFVFQTFNLLPQYSAVDNVCVPLIYSGVSKSERIQRANDALDNVGLAERKHHKPSELSGGQRQRIAVARALINNPAIILADEPTGNLDSKTSIDIMNLFDSIHKQGNTVILVTHEEDIAMHAHRIIRLKDGLVESDMLNKNITIVEHSLN